LSKAGRSAIAHSNALCSGERNLMREETMAWTYVQKTGVLSHDGEPIGTGYSGNAVGLNNPDTQDKVGVGPIPCGTYRIAPAHEPPDHLGPMALPLIPARENNMFGRSAFFIHGDNAAMDHTASNGCIILARPLRREVIDSDDTTLVVVAT
jgi:hypothetical protein